MLLFHLLKKMRGKPLPKMQNAACDAQAREDEEIVLLRRKLDADSGEEGMTAGWLYGFKRIASPE